MHEEAIYIVKYTREGDEFSTFVEADDAANAMFLSGRKVPKGPGFGVINFMKWKKPAVNRGSPP